MQISKFCGTLAIFIVKEMSSLCILCQVVLFSSFMEYCFFFWMGKLTGAYILVRSKKLCELSALNAKKKYDNCMNIRRTSSSQ